MDYISSFGIFPVLKASSSRVSSSSVLAFFIASLILLRCSVVSLEEGAELEADTSFPGTKVFSVFVTSDVASAAPVVDAKSASAASRSCFFTF